MFGVPPTFTTMASDAEVTLQGTSMYRHWPVKASDCGSKGLWAERSPSLNRDSSFEMEEYIDCTTYHHQSTQRGNTFTGVHSAHAKPRQLTAPLPGTQHPPLWEVTSLVGHAAVLSTRPGTMRA